MSDRAIKIAICPRCKGWVSASAWDILSPKEKSEFMIEAGTYNADVTTMTQSEWQNKNLSMHDSTLCTALKSQ